MEQNPEVILWDRIDCVIWKRIFWKLTDRGVAKGFTLGGWSSKKFQLRKGKFQLKFSFIEQENFEPACPGSSQLRSPKSSSLTPPPPLPPPPIAIKSHRLTSLCYSWASTENNPREIIVIFWNVCVIIINVYFMITRMLNFSHMCLFKHSLAYACIWQFIFSYHNLKKKI